MRSQHQCGGARHEISGHVGREQALQAEESGGVDEAAVKAQLSCETKSLHF
jgi:hypothetical protein